MTHTAGRARVFFAADTSGPPRVLDVSVVEAADCCRDEAPTNATYASSGGGSPADLAAGIPGTTETSADIVECWNASFAVVNSDIAPDELETRLGGTADGDIAQGPSAQSAFADDDIAGDAG